MNIKNIGEYFCPECGESLEYAKIRQTEDEDQIEIVCANCDLPMRCEIQTTVVLLDTPKASILCSECKRNYDGRGFLEGKSGWVCDDCLAQAFVEEDRSIMNPRNSDLAQHIKKARFVMSCAVYIARKYEDNDSVESALDEVAERFEDLLEW